MKHCNNYWTKDKCRLVALKYSNRNSFRNTDASAYRTAIAKKWLDEICSHMTGGKKPDGYWNKDHCKEEALKYKNKTQFRKNCSSAYNSAKKNKWLKEFF